MRTIFINFNNSCSLVFVWRFLKRPRSIWWILIGTAEFRFDGRWERGGGGREGKGGGGKGDAIKLLFHIKGRLRFELRCCLCRCLLAWLQFALFVFFFSVYIWELLPPNGKWFSSSRRTVLLLFLHYRLLFYLFILDEAPPRPPPPEQEAPPRPPSPVEMQTEEIFSQAPQSNQPIMVSFVYHDQPIISSLV